jgi:carbonic anhydrase/acetyltransferase-like protein (isoleucine patch superfamily)
MTLELDASGDNELELGDHAELLNNVRILLRSGTVLLGPRSQVRDAAWIKADGRFQTGEEVTIGPSSAVHCTGSIRFDDLVGLAERVSVIDSEHTFDGTDEHYMKKALFLSPVHLGRQTMVAFGSAVLRGSDIGANSVVAANSVVRAGTYPAASLLAGNPAERVRDLRDPEDRPRHTGSGRVRGDQRGLGADPRRARDPMDDHQ